MPDPNLPLNPSNPATSADDLEAVTERAEADTDDAEDEVPQDSAELEFNDVDFDDYDGEDDDDDLYEEEDEDADDDLGVETDFIPTEDAPRDESQMERVSKLIARAGIASRRGAEDLITTGEVSVNGHFVREPGVKADPRRDKIFVSGRPLIITEKTFTVVLLHKPKSVMTTRDRREDRQTVFDLLPHKFRTFHSIGRLDFDTSGVLLLTDDGELTHLLTHPSHGAEKEYEARVRGEVLPGELDRLRKGVRLEDGVTAPCYARVAGQSEKNALVVLRIREGRNRQVRRMLDSIGHPVSSLRRTKFAGVELEGLPAGSFRVLLPGEVKLLRKRVENKVKAPRRARSTPPVKAAPKPKGKPQPELKGKEAQRARDKARHAAWKRGQSDIARRIEKEWQ